jgi:hypothetical protein
MMATTHAFLGAVLASTSLLLAPEHTFLAVIAGAAGGLFPDLDVLFDHRKTLHFPTYYTAAFPLAGTAALLLPGQLTIAAAYFFLGAASHVTSDIFGGGNSMRPWEEDIDRAVYNHHLGEWHAPRRLIPYDGSPQDLAITLLLGAAIIALHSGIISQLTAAGLAIATGYALTRKTVIPRLLEQLPDKIINLHER